MVKVCWFCGRHRVVEGSPGLCEHCSACFLCAQLSPWTFSVAAYMVLGMQVYGAVPGDHETKARAVNEQLERETGLTVWGRIKE